MIRINIIVLMPRVFLSPLTFSLPTRCALDGYPNDTYAVQNPHHAQLINSSIPVDEDGAMDQCHIYRPDTSMSRSEKSLSSQDQGHMVKVECDRWVYDHKYFDRSVIEEVSVIIILLTVSVRLWRDVNLCPQPHNQQCDRPFKINIF